MKANQELFDGCGDTSLRQQWDLTIDQQNEYIAKNRELLSEISLHDRKAQNAALRAEEGSVSVRYRTMPWEGARKEGQERGKKGHAQQFGLLAKLSLILSLFIKRRPTKAHSTPESNCRGR